MTDLPFENNEITVAKVMAGMVALVAYFIPALIARDKTNWRTILIFNLLAGWTVIGWLIALIWALKSKSKTANQH